MDCRRLVRDYELLLETSETFIYLAIIRIKDWIPQPSLLQRIQDLNSEEIPDPN